MGRWWRQVFGNEVVLVILFRFVFRCGFGVGLVGDGCEGGSGGGCFE